MTTDQQQIQEQPWVPAGLAAKLVVGAFAIFHIRLECPYSAVAVARNHDGRKVRIIAIKYLDHLHNYAVRTLDGKDMWLAALPELEPLDTEVTPWA